MKKLLLCSLALVMIVLAIAGCGKSTSSSSATTKELTFNGETYTVPKDPQRIAVLSNSVLSMLYAVDGKAVSIRSPKDSFDLGIGMIHQHFKLIDVMTAAENIILGFDMFHFEYPDKDHHVKDMGLNIRYNVLKERADTIIFHADMYMRDSSGHFMKYPKGDLKIRFNVLAYPHTTELPKDGVKIGAIDTFEIAYADGRDHHVSGY